MKRYIVEVTRTGYREVEAEDCNSAEEIADNLNACDGVQWSDFVNVVRAWEKDYEGMRWGIYHQKTEDFCYLIIN